MVSRKHVPEPELTSNIKNHVYLRSQTNLQVNMSLTESAIHIDFTQPNSFFQHLFMKCVGRKRYRKHFQTDQWWNLIKTLGRSEKRDEKLGKWFTISNSYKTDKFRILLIHMSLEKCLD